MEAVAYAKYEVDCPVCDEVLSLESDPVGEIVECGCGARILVTGTR